MPDLPAHPRTPAPQDGAWLRALAGIDEGALLDWVEGSLPPQAQADLAAAHPNLVPLVSRMRRDRAVLSSIESHAPAGLDERLNAALERDALLGLADGQPVSDALPISQVAKPKAPRPTWMPSLPRLAMAAGFTLLVTVGALVISRSGAPGTPGPVAIQPEPVAAPGSTIGSNTDIAADDAPEPDAPAITAKNPAPLVLAAAEPDEMTDARALALAQEGRLVIRIHDIAPDALARLESGKAIASRSWQISRDLPESTLAMLAPAEPNPSPTPLPDAPKAFAGVASAERSSAPSLPIPYARPVAAPAAVGFAVSTRADEPTLKSLRESLARTIGAIVTFEESATPFLKSGPRPSEAVLWWNQPPATWAPRAEIPLVVELR